MQTGSLIDLIDAMPKADLWHDAALVTVFEYVRKSKLLKLPSEMKAVIPESLC